jgi:hypothetical protein
MKTLRFRLTALACTLVQDEALDTNDRTVVRAALIEVADALVEPGVVFAPPLGPLLEAASDAIIPFLVDEALEVAFDPARRKTVLENAGEVATGMRARIGARRALRAR